MVTEIKWTKTMNKLKSLLFSLAKIIIFISWGAYAFFMGARYYETGRVPALVAKYLGAPISLTGGTVLVSGTCEFQEDSLKKKGLLRDQVTIFKDDGEILKGVVRKDKTFVNCDRELVDIDQMPLLQNVLIHKLIEVPENDIIFEEKVVVKEVKDWSFLEKKNVMMTASSCKDHKEEPVENFIEKEVTILKAKHISMDDAELSMIRTDDNKSLICNYKNVFISEKKAVKVEEKEERLSLMDQRVYVTGRCIPHKTNISNLPVKLNNYLLKETPIRVIDERYDGKKLKMVSGVILEENDPVLSYKIDGEDIKLPILGHAVECLKSIENPISVIENPILKDKEGEN